VISAAPCSDRSLWLCAPHQLLLLLLSPASVPAVDEWQMVQMAHAMLHEVSALGTTGSKPFEAF